MYVQNPPQGGAPVFSSELRSSTGTYIAQLRSKGLRVVNGCGETFWQKNEWLSLERFPVIPSANPLPAEIRKVLREGHGVVATYVVEPDDRHPPNALLYERHAPYLADALSHSARQSIKRALRELQIDFIPVDVLEAKGFAAFSETRTRIGLSDGTLPHFERICSFLGGVDAHFVIGAMKGDELAGFMGLSVAGGVAEILYFCTMTEHQKLCTSDGLVNFCLDAFLNERAVASVSFGLSSLQLGPDPVAGLDRFKQKVGFEAVPVRRMFALHPWLAPVVDILPLKGLLAVCRMLPHSRLLQKGAGMLRLMISTSGDGS
jgi:hypothetical protein